ncbi:FAD-dependent oxidoreductase [Sedimentibacter hydroxybenzoicus DSM 7310]|uniref:FAD-dependent oxidoreductase n=1 Tax=Sedimentibacter hydroxybenzoicus DSM 7310 TaxID=1123245 RepID=A0A974BHV0_SEDHY|nr:FAD-dependent oxidoreductase [Sedimentibacter hydroxybenzoicus]NYB72965.1 FAD-dependent oxidoreductase [Sedimentibacter hydroxybenzoicus DSM 7310]
MSYKYEHLMEPIKIGSITVKNRYAVGPMGGRHFIYGTKGEYSENGIDYFVDRARGGFGLIVTGSNVADLTVDPFDPINGNPNPMYAKTIFSHGARTMVERIHTYGSKIFMQISMGPGRMRDGKTPSSIPYYKQPDKMTTELTKEEIETKIDAMIRIAQFAQTCGYDGVEIHGMHWGYLLDQFAMAYTNKRTDEYGGDLDGRLTVIRKIIRGVKEACGENFPVSVRMCMKTFMADYNESSLTGEEEVGRTIEEAVEIAKRFEQYGVDLMNVNSGTYDSFYYCVSPYYMPYGYNIDLAKQLKDAVNIPIFVAGEMDDPDLCEKAIAEGKIDGVTIARASLVDGHYPKKVAEGKTESIRPCIRCTNCIDSTLAGGVPMCSANPAAMRELNYGVPKALITKKVIIVGGGVAGMEAARTAKIAGHDVEIYEKSNMMGGHLNEAGNHPFKDSVAKLNKWYQREMDVLGITVHLNTEMTAEDIKKSGADVAILAVGSDHFVPPIPGYDHAKSVECYDALMDKVELGQKVVIVGGGLTGSELAYELAAFKKKDVTIVEALDNILSAGTPIQKSVKMMLTDLIDNVSINIQTKHKIAAVTDDGAVVLDQSGKEHLIEADNVIFAIGLRPKKSIAKDLLGTGIEVYEVGDGTGVGNIRTATAEAYQVARKL